MITNEAPMTLTAMPNLPGMLDRSRVFLAMFMFAIFAFNPFGTLLNGGGGLSDAHMHGAARTLQGVEEGM